MMRTLRTLIAIAVAATALVAAAPSTPVAAVAASMPTQLAVGTAHTCYLDNTGSVWCVGSNANGQLGDGTTNDSLLPVRVNAGPFASVYASTGTTCAISTTGDAWCWGANANGQLGDGTTTDRYVPTKINGYSFTTLTMSSSTVCGLITGGYAYCWGGDGNGQLGDNDSTLTNKSIPTQVYNTTWTWKSIVAGTNHMCAIRSTDAVYCWGWNLYGQIGDGSSGIDRYVPRPLSVGGTYKAIAPGSRHTCAIRMDDAVYCWGYRYQGILGDGQNSAGVQANAVAATNTVGFGFTSLFAGNNFTCGVDATSVAYCWGQSTSGQMGNGASSSFYLSPTVGYAGEGITSWAKNFSNTTCYITKAMLVKCSGVNGSGQLGNGVTTNSASPVKAKFILAQLGASANVTIDTSFMFTVSSRATACNGQLATMVTSTPTAVDLGHLNASTLSGGAHDLSIASNAGNGGAVYLRSALATRNLVGTSGSIADSGATAPVAGIEGFGYTTSDSNRGLASNTFATLTNVNAEVAYSASGSISPAQCVGYQSQCRR